MKSSEKKKTKPKYVRMTLAEWQAEGKRRFGENQMEWRWKCPVCGYVCSTQDYKDAGAKSGAVAFSCIGRWLSSRSEAFSGDPGPCNYAGGGLFGMNPVHVVFPDGKKLDVFEFAPRKRKPRTTKAVKSDEQPQGKQRKRRDP